MPTCVDYNFEGAVKPCLGNCTSVSAWREQTGNSDAAPLCIEDAQKHCPWVRCCDLLHRDPSLPSPTAPKSGRICT